MIYKTLRKKTKGRTARTLLKSGENSGVSYLQSCGFLSNGRF